MSEAQTFKKIGFLVHAAELIVHYGPVMGRLGLDNFQIIVNGSPFERQQIVESATRNNINHVMIETVIAQNYHYPVLVSNHCLEYYEGQPLITRIGLRQVRFMYALGKGKHNFADWNNLYDIILCFGPYQVERLSFCKSTIKIQMGYPRYDKYFNMQINKDAFLKSLNCDPNKKTIVWMPTWKALSSMDLYGDELSKLSDEYNIIAKPHPLSKESEPDRINALLAKPFTKVIPEVFDNMYLYKIADYIFCDYGGPSFGALYLDKNLLLLNILNPENDPLTGENSPDILLREDITNINPEDVGKIRAMLKDKTLWDEQAAVRQVAREKFFAPHYGFSSDVAALAIRNTETILKAN